MFKKLLSNLPFNPSLIGQVSFYAKRLRSEERLRRMGLIFVALSLFVQMFAALNQPEPSLALSQNDMIPGGFSTQAQAVNHCNANNHQFRTVLAHYGIDCGRLASASVQTIRSTDHNRKLLSMGRLPYGKAGERAVTINGRTYYQRYLWAWDTGAYSSYKALVGTRADGTPFMVLFNCGNLTVVETPPPPPPPKDVCPNKPGTQTSLSECDVCPNKPGVQYTQSECDVCPTMAGIQTDASQCDLCPNIPGVQTSEGQCDVCPNKPGTQSYVSQCDVCPNKTGVQYSPEECDVCPHIAGIQTRSSECDVCPNKYGIQTSLADCDVCPKVSGIQTKTSECDVCPNVRGTQSSELECRPCEQSENDEDTSACLIMNKTARNNTQRIADANGTVAQAGDSITYTLSVKNTGKVRVEGFVVEENIADILDYADVVRLGGGTLGDDNILRWPATNIRAGSTIRKYLTVKIKDPIPQTPIAASNPGTFDLTMTNVYGPTTVEIKLPPSITKTTEQVVQRLPETGPGESVAMASGVTMFIGYFFARTRLYRKEIDVVRTDYAAAGGY